MATSTITSRGQTTIPRKIRENNHLQEGDQIEWVETVDGHIEIIPVTRDAARVAGLFNDWVKRPVSIENMGEAVKEAAAGKFRDPLK
ncbi:MAG: AbrB/MazE/SpoVT family DNA-binding domain-containing protein [Immundisolibacteraceae bacterium]|nr:AbrB/MazE/SpoVT family DNA-binding domain-containing protein [Immundisolibacteraceae bacterium]